MKRRLFSLVLAILMIISVLPLGAFAADTDTDISEQYMVQFSVEDVTAEKDGDTVSVSINLDRNAGFAGMIYQLSYNKDVLVLEEQPVVAENMSFDFVGGELQESKHIGMLSSETNVYELGTLLTYTFKIQSDAKAGTYGISLITAGTAELPDGEKIDLEVLDEDFYKLENTVKNGSVTIPGYTVSYNANGGSGAPASVTKSKNVDVQISSVIPEKDGYQFLGWATSADATSAEYRAGDKYGENADVTFYAVWKKIEVSGGTIDLAVSDDAEAKAGEEVEVVVSIANNLGMNGIQFEVVFDDTKLGYVSAELVQHEDPEVTLGKFMFTPPNPEAVTNKLNIGLVEQTTVQNLVGNGDLVKIKFKVLEDAKDGFAEVAIVPVELYRIGEGLAFVTVEANVQNGGVTIKNEIPGDINLDEAVNSDDAVLLLKHISEGEEIYYRGSVDFNGDGKENEDDAAALLRYVLFPDLFDIEEASLAAESEAVYKVEDKLGYTGEEVEVAITLEAVKAFKAAGIANINYDKNVFTLNSCTVADEFGNLVYVNDISDMTFVAAAEDVIDSYNGKILTLNFTINENATPGDYQITGTPAIANNVNMNTTIYAGVVTVKHISEKPIIPVEKVDIEESTVYIPVGNTMKLNAIITPDEATNKKLTWETSDIEVAEVNAETGLVRAVSQGTAKITAISDNGKKDTCTVNVIIPADAVEVTPGATSVAPGKTLSLKAKAICTDGMKPQSTAVTFEIIDGKDLATIDAKGKITAGEEEGEIVVRITAAYGTDEAYKDITIKICLNLATKVTLNKTKAGMALGYGDLELSAVMDCKTGECTDTLTWSVDKPEVATVDENGVVTAHSVGKAKVTAMSGSGKKATCTITVGEVPATKVDLSGLKTTSVVPGKNITLKAKAGRDDKTKPVSTAVDFKIIEGAGLATIDAKGKLVAGSEEGTVIVRVKVEAGTAYEDVEVTICTGLASKVTLNKTKAAMALGYGDLQLEATMVSKEAVCEDTLRWIVDKPEIATVDENGLVTAHSVGKAKITAMAGSGKSASCTVTIGEPATGVELSSLKATSVAVGKNITLKGKAVRDDGVKPVSTTVEFEILEGHEFATIDAKGKLTGIAEGDVVVRISAEAGTEDAYEDVAVRVCVPATKVTLDTTKATMMVGEGLYIEATTLPEDNTDTITWSVDKEWMATVYGDGEYAYVSAHSEGTVKVTATTGSGKKATCTITVKGYILPHMDCDVQVSQFDADSVMLDVRVLSPSNVKALIMIGDKDYHDMSAEELREWGDYEALQLKNDAGFIIDEEREVPFEAQFLVGGNEEYTYFIFGIDEDYNVVGFCPVLNY